MTVLIDELLQFSRMGRTEIRRSAVNLAWLVEDIRRELEPETRNRTVRWQISSLPEVNGDPLMLRLAMTNLLSNALKYSRTRLEARIACHRPVSALSRDESRRGRQHSKELPAFFRSAHPFRMARQNCSLSGEKVLSGCILKRAWKPKTKTPALSTQAEAAQWRA